MLQTGAHMNPKDHFENHTKCCEMKGSFRNKKNWTTMVETSQLSTCRKRKKGQVFCSEVWIQPRAMTHHGFHYRQDFNCKGYSSPLHFQHENDKFFDYNYNYNFYVTHTHNPKMVNPTR